MSHPPRTLPPFPLEGRVLGLSTSNSPEPDLAERGLTEAHQDHVFFDLTRSLLANGATLAYGGDHRIGGYTEILLDMVRTYDLPHRETVQRIRNYLAWPLYERLKTADRARLVDLAELIEVPPPKDLTRNQKVRLSKPIPPQPAANRLVWARCLSAMRRRMNDEIDARILLGGQTHGFLGKYPGLAEEAHLALATEKPVFLLGGFGGCTATVVRALRGEKPNELTLGFVAGRDPVYKKMVADCTFSPDDEIDYDALAADFERWGHQPDWSALHNGLSAADNEALFETADVDRMVALVIKGSRGLMPDDPRAACT